MKKDKEDLKEVLFVVKDDTAWVREVTLGIHSDTQFEILKGVEKDDIIITGPFRMISRDLHSGDRVKFDLPEEEKEKAKDSKEKESGENT